MLAEHFSCSPAPAHSNPVVEYGEIASGPVRAKYPQTQFFPLDDCLM
jgi:hypothetical protein